MKLRWVLKIFFFSIAILCWVEVGIMLNKLSFIDWPYLIGGLLFLIVGLIVPTKKK
jgi:hypothetical protein